MLTVVEHNERMTARQVGDEHSNEGSVRPFSHPERGCDRVRDEQRVG